MFSSKNLKKNNFLNNFNFSQGVSRAPAVAMAYLIMFENKNVEDALSLIKKNYSKAEPNIGFVLQLEELYTKNLNENLESETGLEKKIKIYI